MRKQTKNSDSKVLKDGLKYRVGMDNSKLKDLLLGEQLNFCAYTETYFGRSDKSEIDHFDPTLKGLDTDGYRNWYVVKARWNSEKSNKWDKYQPVMHPTDKNFEDRIVYTNGEYYLDNENDIEAANLIKLLKLDDPELANERKAYLNRQREFMQIYDQGPSEFYKMLLHGEMFEIRFVRAIKEEFDVDIIDMFEKMTKG